MYWKPTYIRRLQKNYSHLKQRKSWFSKALWVTRSINTLFGTVVIIVAVVLLIVLVCTDLRQEYVVIDHFNANVHSQMAGVTSEIIRNAFIDRLRSIQDSASTRQQRNVYVQAATLDQTLDWDTVERATTLEILIRTLRGFVNEPKTTIRGTIKSQGDSIYIYCQIDKNAHKSSNYLFSGTMETVDSILINMCHFALRDLEPYTLASYLYNIDRDSSHAMVQHCLSHEPTSDDYLAYFLWGIMLDDEGKNDKAIAIYEKSIELRPDFSPSYTNKGVVHMDEMSYDTALTLFQRVADMDADNPINLINLGRALNKLGRYREGRTVLERSIDMDPYFPAAYVNLGVGFHEQGDSAKALEMYRKSIEVDSTFAMAYFDIGTLYHDNEELPEAIKYYLLAISYDSTYSPAYSDCGVALAGEGFVDSALVMYRKAIAIDSTDPKPYHNWGNALYIIGKYTDAISQYEMTINLCPECSTAVSARQWIDSAKARLIQ